MFYVYMITSTHESSSILNPKPLIEHLTAHALFVFVLRVRFSRKRRTVTFGTLNLKP